MLTVVRCDSDVEQVDSIEELDALLDRLDAELPPNDSIAVEVERPDGDTLLVVLGGPDSYLGYTPARTGGPSFSSLGDPNCAGTFVFFVQGHWTGLPRYHAISPADVRAATKIFVQMDKGLPPNVTWVWDNWGEPGTAADGGRKPGSS